MTQAKGYRTVFASRPRVVSGKTKPSVKERSEEREFTPQQIRLCIEGRPKRNEVCNTLSEGKDKSLRVTEVQISNPRKRA
jgi:hypothetical protein